MISQTSMAAKYVESESENISVNKTERYIRHTYDQLKFPKMNKLKFEAFRNGFYGYLNLVESGKLTSRATLSICDFTLSSNEKRLWVIDIKNKKVLFNTLVAHGMGTGEEYAVNFSNTPDSHQSSLGFYVTGETYTGNNGYSLKLNGVDGSFNSNAYERAVVIHGAEYVSEEFAKANQRLGRSHGCPALPVELAPKIIDRIKDGHCLFIYANSKQYAKTSYWLNNKIVNLPSESELMELNFPVKNNPRYVQETNNQVTDSKERDKKVSAEPILAAKSKNQAAQSNNSSLNQASPRDYSPEKYKSIIVVTKDPITGISDTCVIK